LSLFKKKIEPALIINKEYQSNGVGLTIQQKGEFTDLPVRLTLSEAKSISNFDQLQLVEDLFLDDVLHRLGQGKYLLSYDSFYALSEEECDLLNLPSQAEPVDIHLDIEGFASSPNFKFVPNIDSENYPNLHKIGERIGAIINLPSNDNVLLEQGIYHFLDDLEQKPSDNEDNKLFHYIARIKKQAKSLGISVNEHIERENYEFIDDIDIDVKRTNEGIDLLPEYKHDTLSKGELDTVSNSSHGYKKVGNKRLFVDSETQSKAEQIKSTESIKGPDIPKFAENPTAFIPENLEISLDDFSERVRDLGIRVYKAQPFVHANKSENGWFDYDTGYHIKDVEGNTISQQQESYFSDDDVEEDFKQLDHNTFVSVPDRANEFQDISAKIKDDAVDNPTEELKPSDYILEIFENIQDVEFNQPLQEMKEALYDDQVFVKETPSAFTAKLKPFQEEGYVWLKTLHSTGYGGLLADDMGLGKTVQVIAYLAYLKEKDRLSPTLLVLPKSLIDNWINEMEKFSPGLTEKLCVHLGPERIKDYNAISRFDIVLTTYQTLVRDQLVMGRVDWEMVICDEAQNIKNPTTSTSVAVKALKNKGRLALTGTPVENNLTELWSIIDFVQSGRLGSLKGFKRQYETPLIDGDNHEKIRKALEKRIHFIYKRRTKSRELGDQLPNKFDQKFYVRMGKQQSDQYKAVINGVQNEEIPPLQGIMKLKMIASHPGIENSSLKGIRPDKVPKLEKTLKILKGIKDMNEKVIIFTEYLRMQAILKSAILETFDTNAPIMNGGTGSRQHIVDYFNNSQGFNVMILSPKAAGTGLTITGANHVIHYTRWWNPAVENQATDRVYRIGQEKDVHVYYPIVQGDSEGRSAEEIVDDVLSQKKELAENVIVPSKDIDIENEVLKQIPEFH